jgi:hypothetical protein
MADITGMLQAAAGNAGEDVDPFFQNTVLLLHGDGTNGAQNNTFLDASTNNFTITRNGNTTQGTFSPFSKPDGRWGNFFDGSGDYLSIADNAALDPVGDDFTIEAWVYPLTNSAVQSIHYKSEYHWWQLSKLLSTKNEINWKYSTSQKKSIRCRYKIYS